MTNSNVGQKDEAMYYFLGKLGDKYHTLFISWISDELVDGFKSWKTGKEAGIFDLRVAEHKFVVMTDEPMYLLNLDNKDALRFAGDDGKLDLFPSRRIPANVTFPTVIDFPSYWTKEVEPLLELKLADGLYKKVNDVWVPVETKK